MLQNQYGVAPVAPVAPVASVAPVAPVAPAGYGYIYQNLDFVNPVDGHVYPTYLQNQYGFLGLPLQNLDFVNPVDGHVYPTYLQNQIRLDDIKGSFSGNIGGFDINISK